MVQPLLNFYTLYWKSDPVSNGNKIFISFKNLTLQYFHIFRHSVFQHKNNSKRKILNITKNHPIYDSGLGDFFI